MVLKKICDDYTKISAKLEEVLVNTYFKSGVEVESWCFQDEYIFINYAICDKDDINRYTIKIPARWLNMTQTNYVADFNGNVNGDDKDINKKLKVILRDIYSIYNAEIDNHSIEKDILYIFYTVDAFGRKYSDSVMAPIELLDRKDLL